MLLVSHQQFPFILANISRHFHISNSQNNVFPFLMEYFSIFYNRKDSKINLITLINSLHHKKRGMVIKNGKTFFCITRKFVIHHHILPYFDTNISSAHKMWVEYH